MSILYFLIPIAIVLVIIAVVAFFWAVKSGQFEDLERHGTSILFEEDDVNKQHQSDKDSNEQ